MPLKKKPSGGFGGVKGMPPWTYPKMSEDTHGSPETREESMVFLGPQETPVGVLKTWMISWTTLPKTNSSLLKMGLRKRKVVFQPSNFKCYVSFMECKKAFHCISEVTPLKLNKDTKNCHIWMEIHFPAHHFLVSMLNFRGAIICKYNPHDISPATMV